MFIPLGSEQTRTIELLEFVGSIEQFNQWLQDEPSRMCYGIAMEQKSTKYADEKRFVVAVRVKKA